VTALDISRINEALGGAYPPMMHALWKTMTSGEREWADRYEAGELEYAAILGSEAAGSVLDRIANKDGHDLDPGEKRQLTMLRAEATEHRIGESARSKISELWNRLHLRISTFRAEVDGSRLTDNEVLTILATSRSEPIRKRVWEAAMAIGAQNAPDLLELVRERNAAAAAQGFPDYFEMKLALSEIRPEELLETMAQLRSGLDDAYARMKSEIDHAAASNLRMPIAQLRPWHYEHPYVQRHSFSQRTYRWEPPAVLPRLKQWLRSRRMGDAGFLDEADLWARPGKSQANCCLNIDRHRDIRVLCNLSEDMRGLGVLLHETGHAVYEGHIDGSLPFLLRQPAHPLLSEGAALLFERLAWEPAWLQAIGIAYAYESEHRQMLDERRKRLLLNLYWNMTLIRFERELYRDPNQHLNRLWWDIVEDTQRLHRPADWDKPYWAAKAHLSTLPVYYYNYLYGEIAASQLQHMLELQFGDWREEDALVHMRDTLFRPGASASWQSLLEQCTTCRLDPEFLIQDLR